MEREYQSVETQQPKQHTKLLNAYYTYIRRRILLLDGRVLIEKDAILNELIVFGSTFLVVKRLMSRS